MKHFFISIACMWLFSNPLFAQESKEIVLSFDSDDFGIEYNNKSEGMITFKDAKFSYDEDQTLPCIPYTMVNIAIPSSFQFQDVGFSADYSFESNPYSHVNC